MASKDSPSSEIARLIADKIGIPIPMAEDVYFTVVKAMINIIDRDQRLLLFGFGTFEIDYSYPKTVKNKRAKTARLTPPKVTISFSPGHELRDVLTVRQATVDMDIDSMNMSSTHSSRASIRP